MGSFGYLTLLAQKYINLDRDLKTVVGDYRVVEANWRLPAHEKMWKVKIDEGGTEQWNETYGGNENDHIWSVSEFSDAYILAGQNGTMVAEPGSGDGWVYAFEAATGKQLWRFRVAPAERKVSTYGRLTSTWPVG